MSIDITINQYIADLAGEKHSIRQTGFTLNLIPHLRCVLCATSDPRMYLYLLCQTCFSILWDDFHEFPFCSNPLLHSLPFLSTMTLPYALSNTENHDLTDPFLPINQPKHGCLCVLFYLYKLEMLHHLKEASLLSLILFLSCIVNPSSLT